jgi:hypothetical protein
METFILFSLSRLSPSLSHKSKQQKRTQTRRGQKSIIFTTFAGTLTSSFSTLRRVWKQFFGLEELDFTSLALFTRPNGRLLLETCDNLAGFRQRPSKEKMENKFFHSIFRFFRVSLQFSFHYARRHLRLKQSYQFTLIPFECFPLSRRTCELKILSEARKIVPPEKICFLDFSLENVDCVWMEVAHGSEIRHLTHAQRRFHPSLSIHDSVTFVE